jgi:hypothetical protein
MRFNANRLAHLAGIEVPSNGRRSLNESGNRSRHDEEYDEGVDWYSEDLNEAAPNPFADQTEVDADDSAAVDALDPMEEVNPADVTDADLEEMIEINESMLRQEISRMRQERSQRANTRQQLQEENQLRAAIRKEIGSIVGEMNGGHLYTTKDWMYGDNKPRHSKPGQVAVAGLGIGFK